jgi:hypothetical protein
MFPIRDIDPRLLKLVLLFVLLLVQECAVTNYFCCAGIKYCNCEDQYLTNSSPPISSLFNMTSFRHVLVFALPLWLNTDLDPLRRSQDLITSNSTSAFVRLRRLNQEQMHALELYILRLLSVLICVYCAELDPKYSLHFAPLKDRFAPRKT